MQWIIKYSDRVICEDVSPVLLHLLIFFIFHNICVNNSIKWYSELWKLIGKEITIS
jgi:hypothetical protein